MCSVSHGRVGSFSPRFYPGGHLGAHSVQGWGQGRKSHPNRVSVTRGPEQDAYLAPPATWELDLRFTWPPKWVLGPLPFCVL